MSFEPGVDAQRGRARVRGARTTACLDGSRRAGGRHPIRGHRGPGAPPDAYRRPAGVHHAWDDCDVDVAVLGRVPRRSRHPRCCGMAPRVEARRQLALAGPILRKPLLSVSRKALASGEPEDPPGWERIYEGSFLEAALVTQLSGDFPGPVLAVVSVPFYSADRQRILVPRGARVVGTTQAVANQDQSRLAVSFHRLIYPDGRWVSLEFNGLNQVGEGALKDQVNRHYLSTFAVSWRGRHPERADLARFQSLWRRAAELSGWGRAGARPGRDAHPGSFPESFAHHHHSGRAPASRLVHFRRAGSPAPTRRLK